MMDGVNDNGEATMEKAATDIYTFENLRKNGYTYIDKTAILKHLADDSRGRQFFIARPRRFGKSLAVSTLQCLFEGRRDLFQGLSIEPEWDWSKSGLSFVSTWGTCNTKRSKCFPLPCATIWGRRPGTLA